jgi:hypothetical protein
MFARWFAIFLVLSSVAFAGISDEVHEALARGSMSSAEAALKNYRAQQGVTPDYVEAVSWMARASLQSQQLDRAETYAKQAESLSRQ